jgi:hypothetical protein
MSARTSFNKVPLPFTIAALGLAVSYLYPTAVGPIFGTLLGFAVGVLLSYFGFLGAKKMDRAKSGTAAHPYISETQSVIPAKPESRSVEWREP